MEERPPMAEQSVAPVHPNLNKGCKPPKGGTPRLPPASGPAVAESKLDLHQKCNDAE
jgi:hypothetical protein